MDPHRFTTHAPPLTQATLNSCIETVDSLPVISRVRPVLVKLLRLVTEWWTLPESIAVTEVHPMGHCSIVRLDPEISEKLAPVMPLECELAGYSTILDTICPKGSKPLRDMAFHLLWFATELVNGHEPVTSDKLT